MKKFRRIFSLLVTVHIRESDLWTYTDWKKTHKLKNELKNEISSLLLVKILKRLAVAF